MTEAFLLSSANVGVAGWVVSGDGVTWSLSIPGVGRGGRWEQCWKRGRGIREENTGRRALYGLSLCALTSTDRDLGPTPEVAYACPLSHSSHA